MQSIEICTPLREDGQFIGLNHESTLYDPEALVEPVRIVRNLHKIHIYGETCTGGRGTRWGRFVAPFEPFANARPSASGG